jgi:rubrerythrin
VALAIIHRGKHNGHIFGTKMYRCPRCGFLSIEDHHLKCPVCLVELEWRDNATVSESKR